MWAFLFLAGLFSGWWGALSLAAPPESAVAAPRTSSTSGNTLRTLLFPLTERNSETESTQGRDHLEPYRYNAVKRRSTSLRRRESKFRYDSLPRLRYEEVIASHGKTRDTDSAIFPFVQGPESTVERPRVARAAKNRKERTRTRDNSPREQRRRGRNKERRGQNWCPDVDVGNRAYLAPTVFEGKARSMSSARKPESNYAVTFEVKRVYKSQSGFQPLVKNDSVRLHFRDKTPGKSTLCEKSGIDGVSAPGVVRANIKRGKVYLVFVSRVGPRNFTILGEPIIRSKKNAQAVQAVVRPDYVREVTLSELRDAVARLQEKVKLVCRTRGSPPPRVHWLKDGMPLHPGHGLRIQHKRRRSKVVIASAKAEDSGRYECVAESTAGHRAALAAKLLVTHAPETTTAAWPRQEAPCPISEDFCMNGGTCLFFETVGEPACRCAEGFTGLRCENKDVTSTGSAYNRHRGPFSCKLGLSTSYYC
ncbi:protein vein isoform X1 [Neodiprion virginianus]|uniref:protein vein isoform X1 n=1 Tax=Neodiprion virginianus TaxID=2961670 RepID=UPI001EE6F170|nr:protein vein isoform X1 [Neodiprion virginianus]